LCDNEIVKLEGFPPLKRLSTLLVHNNRIARIGAGLGGALPGRFRACRAFRRRRRAGAPR
jgi:hypothetical protein